MHNPLNALKNSCCGLKSAWTEDGSFRITLVQFILGCGLAAGLSLSLAWPAMLWLLLTASLFPMLIAETINCSIEAVTDKASPEQHPLAKKAKDIGSAAVLLSRLLTALCWGAGIYAHYHPIV